MMNRLLAILFFLLLFACTYGQDISRHEADSLLQLLGKSKPDTGRINILLRLAEFQIFKPGERKSDLDSSAAFIADAKLLNTEIKSTEASGYVSLLEARLTKERGQEKAAKEMLEQAIQILSKGKDKLHLGQVYLELSQYYNYNDPVQIVEKIRLVEYALQSFQQSGNIERQAYCLKFLADLYQTQGENLMALQKLNLSLQAYESIHSTQLQEIYVLYGSIYYNMGNYKLALNYDLMALKNAGSDTSMSLCEINYVTGITLCQLNEREKGIEYFKRALQIAEKYNDNTSVLLIVWTIVQNNDFLNKPIEALNFINNIPKQFLVPREEQSYSVIPACYLMIYSKLKKYSEAQLYCNQLLQVIKLHRPQDMMLNNVYFLVAKFYIDSKQYFLAGRYISKKDSLSKKIGDPYKISENFLLRFRLDTALGNYKSATGDLLQAKAIRDSLFNETISRQSKELEIEYETAKKENALKIKDKDILVLNQKNLLQQSNLKQANLIKDFTFGGIALLIIIIALLYKQYRHKQQSNRVITHKNELLEHLVTEKEWLLKEVHHRVKNNLHTVICLLESQAAYLENDALKAIENSQHRIYAMSLIHQKLYQSEDVKSIDMGIYLPEFIRYLDESFGANGQISFQLDIEPLKLGVSQAIPIALIINEAVTNSIKYAFPGKSKGIIEISMHQIDDQITLIIGDNGIGINPAFANAPSDSLGLKLIKGLSEDINGNINFENAYGTKITIVFNVDPFHEGDILTAVNEKKYMHNLKILTGQR